jgi:hypothetical protein
MATTSNDTTMVPATSAVRPSQTSRRQSSVAFPTTACRRLGSVVTPEDQETVDLSVTAPDMSLLPSHIGRNATVVSAVKTHLFPIVKFITSNDDLDYSVDAGTISAFMTARCGVTVNSRAWWSQYKLKVKRTLADHRNNRIKSMQQIYIGKTACDICLRTMADGLTRCACIAEVNKNIVINSEQEEEQGDGPNYAELVQLQRTEDDIPNSSRQHDYKLLLHTFAPAVVGVAKWARSETTGKLSQVLTVTDEAFLLVVITNYSARWDMMAERLRWRQPRVRTRKTTLLLHCF